MTSKPKLVCVTGPRGAGKTLFIETVLRGIAGPVAVGRCVGHGRIESAREVYAEDQPELERYSRAGAAAVGLLRIPSRASTDSEAASFARTDLMRGPSRLVVLESDRRIRGVDLLIFVAPPLREGVTLLRLVRRGWDSDRDAQLETFADIEERIRTPEGLREMLEVLIGRRAAKDAERVPELGDRLSEHWLGLLQKRREEAPPPLPKEYWTVPKGYDGIQHADLVIVNLRDESQRAGAEQVANDIRRIHSDPAMIRDLLEGAAPREEAVVVAGNLAREGDVAVAAGAVMRAMEDTLGCLPAGGVQE